MKLLMFCGLAILLLVLTTAAPRPKLPEHPAGAPYIRIVRANPTAKNDLEGSESSYIAYGYPYVYPYHWGSHYVLVGK